MTKKQIINKVNEEIRSKGYEAVSLKWLGTEWTKYDEDNFWKQGMKWRIGKVKLQNLSGTKSITKTITVESNGAFEIR